MRPAQLLLGVGWLLFVVSWLLFAVSWTLPVWQLSPQHTGDMRLNGWEAFRVCLSPLWPYKNYGAEPRAVLSGLSNLVIIASLLVALRWRSSAAAHFALSATLRASALLNTQFLAEGPDSLLAGYYCWLASFAVLSVATLCRALALLLEAGR